MRLLIAADEQELVRAIAAILRFYDYQIDTASNGLQALELLQQYSYDGAVLDIMMPGLSGLQVLEQMRQQNILLPVLLLTAKTETEDKITGLNYGADDYLGKPFAMGELVARVNAMTRRKNQYAPSLLKVGNLTLERETFSLAVDHAAVQLSPLEYQIMELLMQRQGKAVPFEQISERGDYPKTGQTADEKEELLRMYVSYLIKKTEMLLADVGIQVDQNGCTLVRLHG